MNNDERLQKIMGLGKESSKKTYYPDFKNNLKQLSQEKEKLEEKSSALIKIYVLCLKFYFLVFLLLFLYYLFSTDLIGIM